MIVDPTGTGNQSIIPELNNRYNSGPYLSFVSALIVLGMMPIRGNSEDSIKAFRYDYSGVRMSFCGRAERLRVIIHHPLSALRPSGLRGILL